MITISAVLLSLALSQQSVPPPSWCTVRDHQFLPNLGLVTISTEQHRVDVRMEKDGEKRLESFEIPDLGPRDFVQEARCGAWRQNQMVLALSIQQGETVSYRYALSDLGTADATRYGLTYKPGFVDANQHWFLSKPLFTSTGEMYRIVAVNDHLGQGDGLEITFRRGWAESQANSAKVEEKVLLDSCGGYAVEPLQDGRAVLLDLQAKQS